MMLPGRRQWLKNIGKIGLGAVGSQFLSTSYARGQEVKKSSAHGDVQPLALKDYQPKSMLHVPETHVPLSRFPNIDFHSHLSWIDRKGKADVVHHAATPAEILQVMDAKNVRMMVNLTGGYGPLLQYTLTPLLRLHTERFIVILETCD